MKWLGAYALTRALGPPLFVPPITLLAEFTTYGRALARRGARHALLACPPRHDRRAPRHAHLAVCCVLEQKRE